MCRGSAVGCPCTVPGRLGAALARRPVGARAAGPGLAVVPPAAAVSPRPPAWAGGRASGFRGVPLLNARALGCQAFRTLLHAFGVRLGLVAARLAGVGGLFNSGLSSRPLPALGGWLVCSARYPHHSLRCGAPGRVSGCCRSVEVVDEDVVVVAVVPALSVVDRRPPRCRRRVRFVVADPLHRLGIWYGFPFQNVFALGSGKGTAPWPAPVTPVSTDPRAAHRDRHRARTRAHVHTSRCAPVTGHPMPIYNQPSRREKSKKERPGGMHVHTNSLVAPPLHSGVLSS